VRGSAGAVALLWGAGVFFTKPVSLYSNLENEDAGSIVICDMALNKKTVPDLLSIFPPHCPISKPILLACCANNPMTINHRTGLDRMGLGWKATST